MPSTNQESTSFVRRMGGISGSTHVETKRSKLGVAGGPRKVDFVFLMEKYGSRKKKVIEEVDDDDVEELPEDPGFLIKFRLSSAYKALEKQEIEASVPLMRPYRIKKSKHRNRVSSPSSPTDVQTTPRSSIDETSNSSKSRKDEARLKLHQQSETRSSWNKLTQTKSSAEFQEKEKYHRRKSSVTFKSTDNLHYKDSKSNSPEVQVFKTEDDTKTGKYSKEGVKFIDEVGLTTAEKVRTRTELDKKRQTRFYIPTTRTVRKLMKEGFGGKLLPDVATGSDCDDLTSSLGSSSRLSSGWSSSSSTSSVSGGHSASHRQRINSANGRRTSLLSAKLNFDEEGGKKHKKINRYLYQMCNCKRTGKPGTISTLTRRKHNLSGVIQIFGCPKDERGSNVVCPFCNIFPQSHIYAWLEDIDSDEEPN